MKYTLYLVIVILFFKTSILQAQNTLATFTIQDTLRGSITPERAWWDANYYHLDITILPNKKYIKGTNTIRYKVLQEKKVLQVDLQPPLKIHKITQDGKELKFTSKINAHFVTLEKKQQKGTYNEIIVQYSGHPIEAINAPWDGGISWKKDNNKNHFIASSCQGLGASAWWPTKDHMYDEVDSMAISVKAPKGLVNVSNGRLRKIDTLTNTYHWFVTNPINNYGVNINIGDYVSFSEKYKGEKGILDMNYYVLRSNLEKAKLQFKEAPKMMKAFEYWFGPYPFYEDSFKIVEVPYLGMEHQSSVTYGNKYKNGYLGKDLSGTGWGLKFDFIIVHEAGHEWFANNITNKDIADMWIHESFTSYAENLFLEYYYGKEAGAAYVIGTRKNIKNDKPIIGIYNVNSKGSGDMYFKGANMLHTLRQLINNDKKWRNILRGLNKIFYHQTVNTKQIENYLNKHSEIELSPFFNQYLRTTKIPIFEYQIKKKTLKYRYRNTIEGFNMPLKIRVNNKEKWITPTVKWQTMCLKQKRKITIEIDPNFYLKTKVIY